MFHDCNSVQWKVPIVLDSSPGPWMNLLWWFFCSSILLFFKPSINIDTQILIWWFSHVTATSHQHAPFQIRERWEKLKRNWKRWKLLCLVWKRWKASQLVLQEVNAHFRRWTEIDSSRAAPKSFVNFQLKPTKYGTIRARTHRNISNQSLSSRLFLLIIFFK